MMTDQQHEDATRDEPPPYQALIDFLRSDDDDWPYELGRIKRSMETILLNGIRDLIAIGKEWEGRNGD